METTTTPAAPRSIPKDELPAMLEDLERSGLSIAAFARARGVRPSPLYRARQLESKRDGTAHPDFVPIRILDRSRALTGSLTVELPSGIKISVPPDFDTTAFERLIGVLTAC